MDRVRLGRALGYGTRQMAKTVAAVAEAAGASAQGPAQSSARQATASQATGSQAAVPQAAAAQETAAQVAASVPQRTPSPASPPVDRGRTIPEFPAPRGLGGRAQHLRRSVWGPLVVFSGALWLRLTGTFFALIATTMATSAWRQRFDLYATAGPAAAHHFWLFAFFASLFGYFAVSSFIRANLKERRARNTR